MANIQEIDIEAVRQFTGAVANKDKEGKFLDPPYKYYDDGSGKKDFRFFRYSQEYPSDLDYGNEEGKAGGSNHIRISGIQLQTLAKCLIDFFGYDLNDVKYDASLNNLDSIQNKSYKNGSPISATIGEIQNGRGNPSIREVSKELKLQIIKRYRPSYATNKSDLELLSEAVTLENVAAEQIGVIGPVTYNFIIRQAVYQWFSTEYLDNPNSFLSKVFQKLNSSLWTTIDVDPNLKYSIFVSKIGQPINKPYPTIGILFNVDGEVDSASTINKAKDIIDSLLLRDTSSLVDNNIYMIEKSIKTRDEEPTRVCVYADLAEVLYCPTKVPNLALIDMIKAGISYLHKYSKEFSKTDDVSSTLQSITKSIPFPSSKFDGLDDFIDKETFLFRKPDMQDMLIKDAVLFGLAEPSEQIYTKPYSLILQDLLSTHFKYTNELISRLESERSIRKNALIRTYPPTPFDEKVKFYYDANFNLLAASFAKNSKKPSTEETPENVNICITKQNNSNLTIPDLEGDVSVLDYLTENTYTKLNDQTVLFITEFFISEYAIPSEMYTENKDLYDKIKKDIQDDINNNWSKDPTDAIVKKANSIPPKQDLFIPSDYSKVKVDYLYSYNKNFLLEEDSEDPTSTLQLVKLKSSNFWTNVFEQIPNEQANLDGFLRKHYPYLTHDPTPIPPTKKEEEEKKAKKIKFERLKAGELIPIPNEVDLSTSLKIDDLLSGDCFAFLTNFLDRKFPAGVEAAKFLDSLFTIINSMDWCYLINYIINLKYKELGDLIKKLSSDANSQQVAQTITNSMESIKQCIPPIPQEHIGDISKPEETFRIACELALQNIPKIPYLATMDFLMILKKIIIELVTQIIFELIIQFLNKIISALKNKFCKPNDKTASALPKVSSPKKIPAFPSPDDVSGGSGCSIVELLSVNPNISKNQIYSVTRSYFNCENISNEEFEIYFVGLSTILQTQEIIDLFSNNVTEKLFSIIKNYSNKKEFSKFSKLVFNLSTTSNFYRFLSRYVDLFPCYEQLAKDTTDPNYCFDPPREQGDYTSDEVLAKANDLLGQITDLCATFDSNQSAILDKLKTPIALDEEAKKAISLGMYNMISTSYNNFQILKQNSINSFETIKIFNDMIVAFNTKKIDNVAQLKKQNPNYYDAFTNILFVNGEPTNITKIYEQTEVKRLSNKESSPAQLEKGKYSSEIITTNLDSESIYYDEKIISSSPEKKDIIPNIQGVTKKKSTPVTAHMQFKIDDYDKNKFEDIFFDDTRFKVYKNIALDATDNKGKNIKTKAKEQKNYYYVYDNLLNNSKNTNIIEDLKKYKQTKEQLETYLMENGVQ